MKNKEEKIQIITSYLILHNEYYRDKEYEIAEKEAARMLESKYKGDIALIDNIFEQVFYNTLSVEQSSKTQYIPFLEMYINPEDIHTGWEQEMYNLFKTKY